MTSQYLNMKPRSLRDMELREEIRQEAMGGNAAQDEADELDYLADKVEELRSRLMSARYHSEAVKFGLDVLHDLRNDLAGKARDIREIERNNR